MSATKNAKKKSVSTPLHLLQQLSSSLLEHLEDACSRALIDAEKLLAKLEKQRGKAQEKLHKARSKLQDAAVAGKAKAQGKAKDAVAELEELLDALKARQTETRSYIAGLKRDAQESLKLAQGVGKVKEAVSKALDSRAAKAAMVAPAAKPAVAKAPAKPAARKVAAKPASKPAPATKAAAGAPAKPAAKAPARAAAKPAAKAPAAPAKTTASTAAKKPVASASAKPAAKPAVKVAAKPAARTRDHGAGGARGGRCGQQLGHVQHGAQARKRLGSHGVGCSVQRPDHVVGKIPAARQPRPPGPAGRSGTPAASG